MFLSDQLIELGLKANPKSNMSQGQQSIKMHDLLLAAKEKGEPVARLANITKYSCKKLQNAGFSYYTFELFFERMCL